MTVPMQTLARQKYLALVERLRSLRGALVAFSGGVDSSLLLLAARDAIGSRAVAVTARSPSLPARESGEAQRLAVELSVRHLCIDTGEVDDPEYQKNPPDRCYLCKRTIFGRLKELAAREGLEHVLEGSNADDAKDLRPGARAVKELGLLAPLGEVGLTKAEVRELARDLGLPVWNKPSLACLASRVPYGSPITPERLRRIDRAEEAIRSLGLGQVRVRDHGEVARVEVEPGSLAALIEPERRRAVVAALKAAGYVYVALDLEGYRTGAMNEALPPGTGA